MRYVINSKPGGFGLSEEAMRLIAARKGWQVVGQAEGFAVQAFKEGAATIWQDDLARNDPDLVEVVEELGPEASSTRYAHLKIVEVPDGVECHLVSIENGVEYIAENHRTWA
jgi:hypothetical protein